MDHLRFTVAKNAIANVTRGGATAVVAIILPHFLTHHLDANRFAAWSLMLQIAAYAGYLDFGLQTAVARYFARYVELRDFRRASSLVSTALAFLVLAVAVAISLIGAVVWSAPRLFQVPPALVAEFQTAAFLMAAGAAFLLPFSAFSGVLVGLHRNEYAALGIGGSRLGGAVLAVIAARYTNSLVVLAVCIAGMNIWGGLLQVFFVRRAVPWLRVNAAGVCRATAHELGKFCASLSVWSFSMFLVAGLDVSVVGYFDFSAVGYYSVASSLVMFFAGANGAVCSALMTPVAALHASGQSERIRRLLLSTSRLNTFVNFVAAAGMLAFGRLVLRLWVGETYAAQSLAYLDILVIANAVRLVANPYASMLVATGQQRQGIAQGLVEGITNFVVSIAAAALLGPIGVALGTLVGALCGVGWSYSFTVKRTTEIPLSRKQFAIEGLVRPLSCALPIVLCAASVHYLGVSVRTLILLSAGTALTGLLAYRFGEMPSMAQIARRRLAPTV